MSEQDVRIGYPKAVHFGILSPEEILEISRVHVHSQDLFDSSEPKMGGLLDYRMGTVDRSHPCETCLGGNATCIGHFGHIELAKPIYNYGFMQYILDTLRCVCPHCSRLLISRRDKNWKKIASIASSELRIRAIIKLTQKMTKCYYPPAKKGDLPEGCGKLLATFKYATNVRIIAQFPIVYPEFSKQEKFLISPEKVRRILEKIDVNDYSILGFSTEDARPHWMIFTRFPVPPIQLRPSNRSNAAARQEAEKTRKLLDIIHFNKILKQSVEELEKVNQDNEAAKAKGGKIRDTEKLEEEVLVKTHVLQMHISLYLDSKSVDQQQKFIKTNKKTKGYAQELSHKEGRFRGNLMGKRNDFTARTVISPDPFLRLNEVAVPKSVARTLTKKIHVNRFNIEQLTEMVKNGPSEVYGANVVIKEDGKRIDLKIAKLDEVLPLKYGMMVERHMINGDRVMFNRQPSLHRMSLMGHKTRILPYSTFRLNLSVVTPYNVHLHGEQTDSF